MMKSLVTIGPSSIDDESIQYFAGKTNLFRLNGSHSDLIWHRNAVSKIRSICPNAFILMDIPGIKPRSSNEKPIGISRNEVVAFGKSIDSEKYKHINLSRQLPKMSPELSTFSMNDGQFIFDVTKTYKKTVIGRSRESFTLLPKKGINIPGSIYDDDEQLEIYTKFILALKEFEIDAIGISFIQTGAVLKKLKALFPSLILVAKVENTEGWRNVNDIAELSDAVMIDRGDLAAEVGFNKLYEAVNEIALVTKSNGKPLIMATENLETMISRDSPSKSEVISLGHSGDIGADCIMLSEETAVSENAKVIVDWLHNFCSYSNGSQALYSYDKNQTIHNPIWKAIGSFSDLSYVLMSKSGYALSQFCAQLPNTDLTLITKNHKLGKLVQLYKQNISILLPDDNGSVAPSDVVWNTINSHKKTLFQNSNTIAAICVSKYVKHSRANSITIYHQNDFR